MSDTTSGADDAPRFQIGTIIRAPDGRIIDIDILPDPDATRDQVLTWDSATQRPKWQDPLDLGFSPTPLILDLVLVDGAGFEIVDQFGVGILVNVPSGG
jgi:hypothetical protein